jgi:hypothetical protein
MRKLSLLILCLPVLILAGCIHTQSKIEKEQELQKLTLKKERYEELEVKIRDNNIKPGTPLVSVRELYGDPDDIFKSYSPTGSFEIWTYRKLPEEKEGIVWESIRLYFNNNKLVSWGY